ncbi:MAG: nucleoside deaminase, partial [Candidatus Aenigmarchaeota archaeon]|nr:nucleoside deaminase [Candidatus Aenigmarchaeota archaeon]
KLDEDPINHAEILAIRKASKFLGTRHLRGYILYTTHEPCTMCASASVWAMLDGVVSGATIQDMAAYRNKYGNGKWLWRTIDIPASEIFQKGTPSPFHVGEFMREECRKLFHS